MLEYPEYNLPVLAEKKIGTWVESQKEVIGVECPFCHTWSHLAGSKCVNPRCGANLRGVQHMPPVLLASYIMPEKRRTTA